MEQLIFVGIIVLFSILEAIGRKKKAGAEPEEEELPAPPPPPRRQEAPPAGRAPTQTPGPRAYDEDVSYDQKSGAGSEERVRAPSSSEGLIPSDVWEEIAAIARGEVPKGSSPVPAPTQRPAQKPAPEARPVPQQAPRPVPQQAPRPAPRPQRPAPAPRARTPAPRDPSRAEPPAPASIRGRTATPTPRPLEPALEEMRGDHPLHATHPGLGKPLKDRLSDVHDGAPRRGREDMADIRRLLRSGNRGSLRTAIVLGEVLGPPASMRDD